MNINQKTGVKSNMEGINNAVKNTIMEDNAEILISMINNGFDINDFTYKNFTGINAIVAYKLDFNPNGGLNILGYLLKSNAEQELNIENKKRIGRLLLENAYKRKNNLNSISKEELHSIITDISNVLAEGAKELFNKAGNNEKVEIIGFDDFINHLSSIKEELKPSDDSDSTNSKDSSDNKIKTTNNTPTKIAVDHGKSETKFSPEIVLKNDIKNNVPKNKLKSIKNEDNSLKLVEKKLPTKKEANNFTMLGDSNYKISSISSYVTLENIDTCKTENISIQANSIEDLNNQINNKISELNSQNDKVIIDSVMEMMKNNSEFKKNLLEMMKEAQIKTF